MRYLLDTHTLLYFLSGSDDISKKALDCILDDANEIFISTASLWEIAIKASLGKLNLLAPFDELFPDQLEQNAIDILQIETAHLSAMMELEYHHRDPFDRLMMGQAIAENMIIVGKDGMFKKYPVNLLW